MEIKNQLGYPNRNMVSIYFPIFKIVHPKALLKLFMLLKKLLMRQNLNTGPRCYAMTKISFSERSFEFYNRKPKKSATK